VRPTFEKLWSAFGFRGVAKRDRLDVLHVQYTVPYWVPCPVVTAIHDVSFAAHPEFFRRKDSALLNRFIPGSIKRAAAIVVPTLWTKGEIERFYPVARGKIEVTPYAGPPVVPAPDGEESARRVRSAFGIDGPFFLGMGPVHPRKNFERVLLAFAQSRHRLSGVRLVIAGPLGWRGEELIARARELDLGDSFIMTGEVADEDIPVLYQAALATCYLSLYEGFGLPVLEAMAYHCPVIASNATSIPEVAGEAALLVDPHEVDAIGGAMVRVASDERLRADLVKKGIERAKSFSWEETARRTLAVYSRIA
jgi:glycosyltransferase involved in cell wall biosynthesis